MSDNTIMAEFIHLTLHMLLDMYCVTYHRWLHLE